ncbi:urease accessory protein UreD [Sulfitobacter porphyrae]|uniref:Urease accessory protein UreD n=1 Tax=Sulfitobacter porphyrae TaxID=1246864 RepID=A0ABW2B344_9RHOB
MSLQPRTRGAGSIAVRAAAQGETRLANLRQSGAMKLVLPRVFRPDIEAVIVNTAGGVTGGDRLQLEAVAGAGACLTLSTQAAERIYRAQPGEVGCVDTRLEVAAGARINWLPQETILFDHAALNRRLTVDLAAEAGFLMVETLVFGRAAMGEVLHEVHLRDRIRINRAGAPLYLDGIALAGDVQRHLARPAIAGAPGRWRRWFLWALRPRRSCGPCAPCCPRRRRPACCRAGCWWPVCWHRTVSSCAAP